MNIEMEDFVQSEAAARNLRAPLLCTLCTEENPGHVDDNEVQARSEHQPL